jgi:tetratricopeptide (TPR) repeat protein
MAALPDPAAAEAAVAAAARDPGVTAAIAAYARGDARGAERLVRRALGDDPDNPAALLLLAEIAFAAGVEGEAERLLGQVHAQLPAHREVALRYADQLFRRGEGDAALAVLDGVLAAAPDLPGAALRRLTILGQLGDYDAADAGYRALLAAHPDLAAVSVGHGHLLKTLGRTADSIAAFRRAIALDPAAGDAWWGLADLKSGALDPADVAAMERALATPGLATEAAAQLHFALGKAHEDARAYQPSFDHYERGNRLVRRTRPHDAAATTRDVDDAVALFTPDFLAARAGAGEPSDAPIFVLGLPRAGSTLVEQILASHSAVEGTAELPYVPLLAHALLAERWREPHVGLRQAIAEADPAAFAALGRRYLALAARHRRTGRPRFIDKLPDNWPNVGLIHLMLPNARIVDARRAPMACGFGNYKQYFTRGRAFAFDQHDIGFTYRDYVRLMAHVDTVLPGRVVRIDHEALLAEPEAQIRALLAALDLPFEPGCLAFHENRRPVRTASAAQVRRPLNAAGTELWRHYRPWLDDLAEALGPLAEG